MLPRVLVIIMIVVVVAAVVVLSSHCTHMGAGAWSLHSVFGGVIVAGIRNHCYDKRNASRDALRSS